MEKLKVLFVGESWFFTKVETKGFDQFTTGGYETEIERVRDFMKDFAVLTHVPAHMVPFSFPNTLEELKKYDAVILSDVGANTFLLHPDTFFAGKATPHLIELIRDYVADGGAFGMMGGYMTFMGIEGKGRWKDTAVEEILPVTMLPYDDRQEHPEGIRVKVDPSSSELLEGMCEELPPLFGYNMLMAKEDAKVLISYNGDPMLALYEYGKGRTFAWASDCAPHWMPVEFCESECNALMWNNVLSWACRRK